jgi:tetratricopeptide (TPR) repeat protein
MAATENTGLMDLQKCKGLVSTALMFCMAFAFIKQRTKTWRFLARGIAFCLCQFKDNLIDWIQSADLLCKTAGSTLAALLLFLLIPVVASAQQESLEKRLQQAATLIRDKRIAEAEQQLNSILKSLPEEAAALNLLGTIRATQGKLDIAETLFTQALHNDPQLVGAHMNLAFLYLLKGAPEKSIAKLKEVLQLAPNNLEALYKLARLQLNQSFFDDCVKTIETVRQSQPLPTAFLVLLGDAYLGLGERDKAEENYLQVLGKQGDANDALLGMAQVSYSRGDSKSASDYLSRAKAGAGNSPDLLYKYALTALKSGVYEEARSALEYLAKINPKEPAYFLALGATWLKKPDLFEAEQSFRQALKLQPNSTQGQMYLGYTLLKQKNYSEARVNLEKCIQGDATTAEPFYYLALIAQEQNDDAKAVALLQKLVERFPAFVNANVQVALGSSYLKLKDYERAKQHLEDAVKLNPDEAKAHYNLAMLYARLKDPQRSKEEMEIVERLKAGSRQAVESDGLAPPAPRRNP